MRQTYMLIFGLVLCSVVAGTGCKTLGKKDTVSTFHYLEKEEYILRKRVSVDERTLKKGEKIRIIVSYDRDWIKVHGYDADIDPLKAERVLLLYLFVEDFPEEKFSQSYFEEKLYEIAKPIAQ